MCALFQVWVFPRYFSYLLVFLLSGNTVRLPPVTARRSSQMDDGKAPVSGCLPAAQACCTRSNSHSLHGFVQGKNKCFLCLLKLIKGGKINFSKTYFSGFVFDSYKWKGATSLNSSRLNLCVLGWFSVFSACIRICCGTGLSESGTMVIWLLCSRRSSKHHTERWV